MKKPLFFLLILSLLISSGTAFAGFPGLSGPEKKNAGKTVKLFNGKNLDGWYTFINGRGKNVDPDEVFTVSNGMIRISGEEYGCITSNDEFENYKITVEFKWGEKTWEPRTEKARDSGFLLHSVGEDGGSDSTWMHSIENVNLLMPCFAGIKSEFLLEYPAEMRNIPEAGFISCIGDRYI